MSIVGDIKNVIETLRALYSQVLAIAVEEVDIELSFIALGGDSFRAVVLFQKCLEKHLQVSYQAILTGSLVDNAALAIEAQNCLDSTAPSRSGNHERFQLMPKDYDFGNIEHHLETHHSLSLNDVESIYPCSLMQENLYIGQKMGGPSLYQTTSVYQVPSSYDLDQIRCAWQHVVDRHQTLRTIYVESSDSSSSRLLDAVVLAKTAGKVVAGTSDERDRILTGESIKTPETGRSTCHQVTVFPDAGLEDGWRLLKLELNHITVDASSMVVVIEELGQALQGRLSLKNPPTGYGKYIEYLQSHTDENRALDYWIEYLDGVQPCYFPSLSDNGKHQVGSSELIDVPLSFDLPQIRQFCQDSNITVATAIQAAWAELLHIYTDEPDVCFGYLCSGRGLPIPGVTSIVGPMMNLMVCRVRDIGNKFLQELVGTIRDDFGAALANQTFSLRNVQRILGNSESKLFNTIVNTFYGPSKLIDDSDQLIKLISSHNASDLDIVVKALYTDVALRIRLAYSSTTLSPSMAKHVAHTFGAVLDRMVMTSEMSSCTISRFLTASPFDMQKMCSWNDQNLVLPDSHPVCVHDLIQSTARKHPTRPAIHAWDGGNMDYETFDKASSALAHAIIQRGIGVRKYIALCFEKSKWYSVALMGVLKSGNAFVPLDLSNPEQRMRKIMDQLRVANQKESLIICSPNLAERCALLAQHTIVLDHHMLHELLRIDFTGTVPPTTKLSDPAYVIYTSGSTGEPKGVIVEHGAYSYAAQTHSPNLNIDHRSRVLQFASYGFDTSMEDHLTTFILGGCLCVPREEDRLSIPDLAAFALQAEANWAHITPSFAEMLTRQEFPTVKTIVLGGEPMTFGNIREWAKPGESCLIQVYGPSECCVTSTVNSDVDTDSVPTDIGTALPGCATWVARPDDPHELCPVGAVGELLMEGPILARGYINEPGLTSAAFVEDLVWAPGRRMYRTGDLAKYDSNGRLHFVGRRDGQVKIHGQRIELGEIERQLLLHTCVQNALMMAPKSGPCANKLVAVVSPSSPSPSADSTVKRSALSSSELNLVDGSWCNLISSTKAFLEERLPAYMVPELWLVLQEIPRNSSAKLDRKMVAQYFERLSSDEFSSLINHMEEQSLERPGSTTEIHIRELWAEVLNIPADEIQYTSSFFSLGGDSISAMMVASLALQQGLSFSGAEILRHRNIQRLAKALTMSSQTPSRASDVAEEQGQHVGLDGNTFPLSPIQRLHFRVSDDMGDPFDQQTIVLRVRSSLDEDSLISAFDALLAAHPMLRARFLKSEDESCLQDPWSQYITPAAEARGSSGVRLRFHSWARDDYIVDSIAEAKSAINIVKGPLIAADFFQGKDRVLLSVTIHHLVIDTVSWRILLQDLEGHLRGGVHIAPEPTSFQAWCLAQQQFASSLNSQFVIQSPPSGFSQSYWAVDQAKNTFEETETHKGRLDGYLMKKLQSICEALRCELIDVLSLAIISSFSDLFGRSPYFFLERHGRETFDPGLDVSNTIGWFTTFSPFQLPIAESGIVDLVGDLIKIRDWRKGMPLNGFSHFISAMLDDSGGEGHLPMEIVLNHLGKFQQVEKSGSLFQRYDGDIQSSLSRLRRHQRSTSRRYALIGVLSVMQDDDLVLEIEWNKQMLHQERIREWSSRLEAVFQHISQNLGQGRKIPNVFGIDTVKGCDIIESTCQKLGLESSNVEAIYPCSPIQDSLMLSQLRQPNGVYSQHFLFRVFLSDNQVHSLDSTRLAMAWKSVVAKHSVLRTIFSQDESGSFLQIVLRHIDPDVQCLALKDEDEEALYEVWANESRVTGVSPLGGKVMHSLKIYLDTTPSSSAYCMLSKNHLITDGVSSRLLVSDFIAAYEGRMKTETTPYADYIDFVCRQDLASTTLYWEKYLNAVTPCILTWNTSNDEYDDDIVVPSFKKTESIFPESRSLNLASQNMDLTSPVVFKAAWAWLLKTYLRSDDVIFGVLSSGRDIQVRGAQGIVGPMATMLPLRTRIPPGTTANELCRRIQEDDIEHMSRQAMSLAKIQHSIKRSDGPLFNTILNIQKSTGVSSGREPTSLQFELLSACDTSEYDLALSITEEDENFKLSMEYPTRFMSRSEATSLLQVFQTAVLKIISEPNTILDTISIATSRDKNQIQKWNAQPWDIDNRLVHQVIQETVAKQPLSPAIWAWDGQFTYSELEIESTRLATHLQAMGCGTGSIVVLCFQKSIWAVVAMLAVPKTGASFVHIDPKSPVERTKGIIQQTGSSLGLCSSGNEARISGMLQTILTVDQSTMASLGSPGTAEQADLFPAMDPSSVLYIIFTSGSTGAPKGVAIQHYSFCSAAKHNRPWLQIEKDSRVLQFTSYCFDASLEEIFTVLIAGGCICIPSEKDRLTDIPGFVRRAGVNWAAFTPSFLRTLSPSDLPSIKFITVHAEPMNGSLVKQWADTVRMRPSYGPTECSVTSTIGAPFTPSSNAANIGWPIGCRGWVVDPDHEDILLPVGAIGELLIDGPIVGKGYLGDPEKTAASFIVPPTWSHDPALRMDDTDPRRRLYKTGDLVRYTADGSLVILGRKDHSQVKVRGQRVEIQEIQHYLDESQQILHSIVIMPSSGVLRGRLVVALSLQCLSAEILPAQDQDDKSRIRLVSKKLLPDELVVEVSKSLQDVQCMLSKALPAYMMPEDWLVLESLPIQVSHKLDRQSILKWVESIDDVTLQMAQELQSYHGTRMACGNPTEEAIREIWGQVLELPISRVSLNTSFFRLGGDSIYAIQVMQRCKTRGLNVTTQDVLANPTIAQLADQLTATSAVSSVACVIHSGQGQDDFSVDASLLPLPRDNVQHVGPCSPFQERVYKAFHDKAHKPYVFDTLVQLIEPPRDPSRLIEAWNQVTERHGILRTVFVSLPNADRIIQVLLKQFPSDAAVVTVTSELDVLEHSKDHLGKVRSRMFVDNSPPLSLNVYVSPGKQTFVHLVISHILIDHVSFAHILSDWQCFYQRKQPSLGFPLPSFDSYIAHLFGHRSIDISNSFWTNALRDVEPCLIIPADYSDTMDKTSAPMEMRSNKFTIELTAERENFCRNEGVTLSNLLQFSWSLLLYLYTGNLDVIFGHLVSDRDVEIPNSEAVVGPMLSVIIARVQFQHSLSLQDSLRSLQEYNIRALGHRIFDIEHVENQLGVGATGLFDSLVNIRKVRYRGSDFHDFKAFHSISKRDPHEQHVVLAFNEGESRLDGEITYHQNMLGPEKVAEMSHTYCEILNGLSSGRLKTLKDVQRLGLHSNGASM